MVKSTSYNKSSSDINVAFSVLNSLDSDFKTANSTTKSSGILLSSSVHINLINILHIFKSVL